MNAATSLKLPSWVAAVLRHRPAGGAGLGAWPRWALVLLSLGGLGLLHLALLAYFAPLPLLLAGQRPVNADYALHFYQAERALTAFTETGHLWGYDPNVLAGHPAGAIEDLTSKGTELGVIALHALGLSPSLAFNAVVLFVFLSVPWLGYLAGRVWGLRRGLAFGVAVTWVLLWWFDSFTHWLWFVGMFSWAFASAIGVILVGLVHRVLTGGRLLLYLPLAFTASLLTLTHPFAVLSVAAPCVVLYAQHWRRLRGLDHALLWGSAALAAATTLVWLGPALRFAHYIGDVTTFFNTTLEYVAYDFLDLFKDGRATGAPTRTLLRVACFVGAGFTLFRWVKLRDSRAWPLIAYVVVTLLFAYCAAYTWTGRQTQPYRQLLPATLAATVPAVVLFRQVFSRRTFARLRGPLLALVVLLGVVAAPRVVRHALFYLPELAPERVEYGPADRAGSALYGMNEPRPQRFGLNLVSGGYREVAAWLGERHGGRGRVVVSEWTLAEYLAAETTLPILGGIPERNIPQGDAHLFRLAPDGALPGAELSSYFERYAVGWVVLSGAFTPLDGRRDVLEPIEVVSGFRVYRVRAEPSLLMTGEGRVVEARLNLIRVEDAAGPEVTLRYHWLESLACRPGCEVERATVEGDRVGFVRVAHPPAAFEIYNRYD